MLAQGHRYRGGTFRQLSRMVRGCQERVVATLGMGIQIFQNLHLFSAVNTYMYSVHEKMFNFKFKKYFKKEGRKATRCGQNIDRCNHQAKFMEHLNKITFSIF